MMRPLGRGLTLACLLLFTPACGFLRSQVVIPALVPSMKEMLDAANRESDVQLVRDALPSNLVMIDGLARMAPANDEVRILAAQAYCSYALAFIMDEDKNRAADLFHKGRAYALDVLFQSPDFKKAYESPDVSALLEEKKDESGKTVQRTGLLMSYDKDDVPALFWTTNCVAGWVQMTGGKPEAVAELPALERIMARLVDLDETYFYGGPHLLWGTYLAGKPRLAGGNPEESLKHFERVFQITDNKFLLAKVFFAQYYARAVMDRDLFESTLKYVIDTPLSDLPPDTALINQVAKIKAKALLPLADDWF